MKSVYAKMIKCNTIAIIVSTSDGLRSAFSILWNSVNTLVSFSCRAVCSCPHVSLRNAAFRVSLLRLGSSLLDFTSYYDDRWINLNLPIIAIGTVIATTRTVTDKPSLLVLEVEDEFDGVWGATGCFEEVLFT